LPFVGYARKGTRGGKSATQLMPVAQPPAKYLCLLLATFACDLSNAKAQAASALAQQKAKGEAQGEATCTWGYATAQTTGGATFAFYYLCVFT
jgi:hypothetical protein